jgi:glutathione S-transferase
MPIDFYYAPRSSASRVHWAIEELDVPCNKIKIDLKSDALKTPEYRALNPNGRVPLLVIDGRPLFESLAQIYYLGERFGVDKGLWPAASDPARLEAMSWTAWGTVELAPAIYAHGNDPVAARDRLAERLQVLEHQLADRPYQLGEKFSLVDVANASATAWSRWIGVDLAPYPMIAAWTDRCMQRPAMGVVMRG